MTESVPDSLAKELCNLIATCSEYLPAGIVKPGTNVNYVDDGVELIARAVANWEYEVATRLLEMGANPDALVNSDNGTTILMIAVKRSCRPTWTEKGEVLRSFNFVGSLLKHGANTDLKTTVGMPALGFMVRDDDKFGDFISYWEKVALMMMDYGAEANILVEGRSLASMLAPEAKTIVQKYMQAKQGLGAIGNQVSKPRPRGL